ncbi:MAG: hypothetical protein J3Q66DRAFT_369537 [Benniella sp.]|nr:MAG: hypothetical protein J3Q66DRAFT_369537 [Benniella sp.]
MSLASSAVVSKPTESNPYAILNQRTTWQNESVNIGDLFQQYSAAPRASHDISRNGIIDITPSSPFLGNTTQEVFDAIAEDSPTLPTNADVPELDELKGLLQQQTSFGGIRGMLWNIPLKTPVRRYLYGIMASYSQFFTNLNRIDTVMGSQVLLDPLLHIIQGALQLLKVHEANELIIVGSDTLGIPVSRILETNTRKEEQDRWKLAHTMKDMWDAAVGKICRTHQPHPGFAVFGLQVFGQDLTFFKMDYRSHYRLWQLGTCMVPLGLGDFHERVATCAKQSIMVAHLVAQELEQRRNMPITRAQEFLAVSWAARNLRETVDSD